MTFRPIIGRGGLPVQQSMTRVASHNTHLHMERTVLGVVWEVKPSDHMDNRFTRGKARRGAFHTCSVVVLNDGLKCNYFIDNVIITADRPTGLDDYSEHLPRPSTKRVTGEALQPKLQGFDPYELDGDWCIVGFVGGHLDMPYVQRWWPHPRNVYDPATSGKGNPNSEGRGRALIQHDRVFKRVNGIEQVITAEGDVYLSTRWANSLLQMGGEGATEGRWTRQEREAGGSIHVTVKPSQSLELTWRKPAEGSGAREGQEDDLPQSNPRRTASTTTQEIGNLHVLADKRKLQVAGQEINFRVSQRFVLRSDDLISIMADGAIEVTAESATINIDETYQLVAEDVSLYAAEIISLEAEQNIDLTAHEAVSIQADESCQVESPLILLGTLAPERLLMGETYNTNTLETLAGHNGPLNLQIEAIAAATTTTLLATATKNVVTQLRLLISDLQGQINASLTTKTKAE